MSMTRTQSWAAFAFLAALICAIGFGQAFNQGTAIAAAVLILDWLVAMAFLVCLRQVERVALTEVHP